MVKSKGFEDLVVWQEGRKLSVALYRLTESFPLKEQFGLTNQIRRAAISVVSNIAEGSARGSNADFARFITMALGSIAEIKAQIIIAKDLKFV